MVIKKIPGSLDYRIDLNGKVYDCRGNIVTLPTEGPLVKIVMYDKERKLSLTKLTLLSWYECGHIHSLSDNIENILFKDADNAYLRIRCGKIMTFSEPIYYSDGFRYIPNYPRYAINLKDEVLDTLTNEIIPDDIIDDRGYSTRYLRVPDHNSNRTVKTHRLKAHAWLPNDDFVTRPLINHIDGVKLNNDLVNLEWCSSAENARHALSLGLNDTGIKTKVRDVRTGTIVVYNSLSEMLRALGMGVGSSFAGINNKLPGYLWKKRYEIKAFADDSPWYYENVDPDDFKFGKSYFTITVFDKRTGKERKFNSAKKLFSAYDMLWKSVPIETLISWFKEKHPYCDIKYDRNTLQGPYLVYDKETNVVAVFESIEQTSKYMGRSKAEIQSDLSRGKKYIYAKRWLISVRSKEFKHGDYIDKPNMSTRLMIIDVETGVETEATSIKHAARITGMNAKTVKNNLKSGKSWKGLVFRALD